MQSDANRADASLFSYIWRHSRRQQLAILFVILFSLPFYFLALELPKLIVNGPIQGRGFPSAEATQRLFAISLTFPDWVTKKTVVLFEGFQLERWLYLVALSLIFLLLVLINGGFKFWINIAKGRLGERMLRRLRYQLVDRVLRFPANRFRRLKASEVASMVKDEVEPLGGFIGDAFVAPAFLAGQALTAAVFIFVQNVWLGLLATLIIAVQIAIIPPLRRRLLELGRQRQVTARELSGRIGEIVDSLAQVRTNDTSNFERADISARLAKIYTIRLDIYQRKFVVKFLNNFLAQLTPFAFFLVGGYFAIRGSLDVGQLLAVIVAYKDLPGPIKELIDWDQQRQDMQIKYEQVVEQLAPGYLVGPDRHRPFPGPAARIEGPIEVLNLAVAEDGSATGLKTMNLKIFPGERTAAVGDRRSGAETLSEALVGLVPPASGQIRYGGSALDELPGHVIGRRVAYVSEEIHLHSGPLRDALLYGLKYHPATAGTAGRDPGQRWRETEAAATGNTALDAGADWIDYAAAGSASSIELQQRIVEVLSLVELDEDVFELGLRSKPAHPPDAVKDRILQARTAFRARLGSPDLAGLVVPFDPLIYNGEATIAENLLLGHFVDRTLSHEALTRNAAVRKALAREGLADTLYGIGLTIARTAVELYGDLPPNHAFLRQQPLVAADKLDDCRSLVARNPRHPNRGLAEADQPMVLGLALGYVEPRLRLGLLDPAIEAQILSARTWLRWVLPSDLSQCIAFYEPERYNTALTIEDNILFGRVVHGLADGPRRVRREIRAMLGEGGSLQFVYDAGLQFDVGSGGRRLSLAQRQKVGLARALLKRPDVLVVNRGLAGVGSRSQRAIIGRVLERGAEGADRSRMSVFWVMANPATAELFDRVLVFEDGAVIEEGRPTELLQRNSALKRRVG